MGKYTMNEINSQAEIWEHVISASLKNREKYVTNFDGVIDVETLFVGCGTSYYLSLSAASVFSKLTRTVSRAYPASEIYLFSDPIFPDHAKQYIPYLISRSGTTTEVNLATKYIQEHYKFPVHGISCRTNSDLLKNSDIGYLIPEADEKSVVMTRSFTSMLLLVQFLAGFQSRDQQFLDELENLPQLGKEVFNQYGDLPEEIISEGNFNKFVYLGQGPFYGLASESMLKIKEMSLTCSEAYHSLEYRHGPKSMADENMLVTFFISNQARDAEIKLMQDVNDLGAKILAICDSADAAISGAADYVVELNSGLSDYARLILYMPITQLLGYYQSLSKNLNPDEPVNLSQVVEI